MALEAGALPQYPLYYYRGPGDRFCVVSSDLESLLRAGASDEICLERLVADIASAAGDAGLTEFQSVRRLRACERFAIDDRGARFGFRPLTAGTAFLTAAPEALAQELRRELDAAIGRATRGARRVTVFVGGGLDSSGILALAVARSRGAQPFELEALAQTWVSPGDDRPHLRALERSLGVEAVKLTARDAAPLVEQSLCIRAQPQSFAAGCTELLLWQTAKHRGADVILSGHGGDQVCGGNISFAPLILRGHPLSAIANALSLEVFWPMQTSERLRGWLVSPLLRPLLPRRWMASRHLKTVRRPWMTQKFLEIFEPMLRQPPPRAPRSPDDRAKEICDFPYFDELSRAWGQFASVTEVAPVDVFRDTDFVRFMAQIDPITLNSGGRFRGLYRQAMRGLLPESLRLRPDKALPQPLVAEAIVAAGAQSLLERLATLEHLERLGLVNPRAFAPEFAAWLGVVMKGQRAEPDETDRWWEWVWPVLAVETFLRTRPPPRTPAVLADEAGR